MDSHETKTHYIRISALRGLVSIMKTNTQKKESKRINHLDKDVWSELVQAQAAAGKASADRFVRASAGGMARMTRATAPAALSAAWLSAEHFLKYFLLSRSDASKKSEERKCVRNDRRILKLVVHGFRRPSCFYIPPLAFRTFLCFFPHAKSAQRSH